MRTDGGSRLFFSGMAGNTGCGTIEGRGGILGGGRRGVCVRGRVRGAARGGARREDGDGRGVAGSFFCGGIVSARGLVRRGGRGAGR